MGDTLYGPVYTEFVIAYRLWQTRWTHELGPQFNYLTWFLVPLFATSFSSGFNHLLSFAQKWIKNKRLVELNNIKSIGEVDEVLKYHAGLNTQSSCKEMTKEDLQELIAWSFQFGDELGLKLNYKDNEWQKIYDNEV